MRLKNSLIYLSSVSLLFGCAKHQPFNELIKEFTKDKNDVCVAVGSIKNNEKYSVFYGENAQILEHFDVEPHFEIGSVSKTITGYLVARAILENKITLNSRISSILGSGFSYDPSIKELCTHSSAYGKYLPEHHLGDSKGIVNPLYGVTSSVLIDDMKSFLCEQKDKYKVEYSNFGMAVLGVVLEKLYNQSYYSLAMNLFKEFGMNNTGINYTVGFRGAWEWTEEDVFIAAGGFSSTLSDILIYAQTVLRQDVDFIHLATTPILQYTKVNQVGMGWIIENNNDVFWHSGAVNQYNCSIRTNIKTGTSVVVLCNYPAEEPVDAYDLAVSYMEEIEK